MENTNLVLLTNDELFTQKEIAEKLGLTIDGVRKIIVKHNITSKGKKKNEGSRQESDAYLMGDFSFILQERQSMKLLSMQEKSKEIINDLFDKEQGAIILQTVSENMTFEQKIIASLALAQNAMKDAQTRMAEKNAELEKAETEIKLLKDEHDTFWSWLRFISFYGEYLVNEVQLKECKTWKLNKLKINGKFLKDCCETKRICVVGSKYDKQLVFNVYQACDFFSLPYPEED